MKYLKGTHRLLTPEESKEYWDNIEIKRDWLAYLTWEILVCNNHNTMSWEEWCEYIKENKWEPHW